MCYFFCVILSLVFLFLFVVFLRFVGRGCVFSFFQLHFFPVFCGVSSCVLSLSAMGGVTSWELSLRVLTEVWKLEQLQSASGMVVQSKYKMRIMRSQGLTVTRGLTQLYPAGHNNIRASTAGGDLLVRWLCRLMTHLHQFSDNTKKRWLNEVISCLAVQT